MSVLSIWFLSSVIGLTMAVYGIFEAVLDARALGGLANGRRLVARQRLYAQLARAGGFLCWVLVGSIVLATVGDTVQLDGMSLLFLVPNILQATIVISDVAVGRKLRGATYFPRPHWPFSSDARPSDSPPEQ